MNEKLKGSLALGGAVGLGYLNSSVVKEAVNTVATTINNIITPIGKGLTAISPVAIPLGLAAGTGYLGKKIVGSKVNKGKIDHYGNTAAIGAGAWGLGTFGANILCAGTASTVAGLGATLFAGTALHKKYGFFGTTLAGATAATIAMPGTTAFLLGHLGLYATDKLLLGNYLRDKFGSVKK